MISKIEEMIREEKDYILEDMQEAIVNAGGCFHRKKYLARMSVDQFLTMCIPNSINISVKHKRGVLK